MARMQHPLERTVEMIEHEGVVFEVVERPDVVWVGTLAYADNLTDEADPDALLERYQMLIPLAPKEALVCPDWSAAISLNYTCNGTLPRGTMFAQETYDANTQDMRHDLYTLLGGLYMRVYVDGSAAKLIGKESCAACELFDVMRQRILPTHGYMRDDEARTAEVEYRCHADNMWYAYIPIKKI